MGEMKFIFIFIKINLLNIVYNIIYDQDFDLLYMFDDGFVMVVNDLICILQYSFIK